jgi:hypothetical protein
LTDGGTRFFIQFFAALMCYNIVNRPDKNLLIRQNTPGMNAGLEQLARVFRKWKDSGEKTLFSLLSGSEIKLCLSPQNAGKECLGTLGKFFFD